MLVGVGALAWAVAGAPTILAWLSGRAPCDGKAIVWCVAYTVFGVAFCLSTSMNRLGTSARMAALLAQSLAALVIIAVGDSGFEGVLLCIVAGQAPLVIGTRAALGCVIAQTSAMLAVNLGTHGSVRRVYFSTASYAAFQLFAFGAARLAASEAAARQELSRVHAELIATQELFADAARTAERLRIARELHDALGHHLTALSIHLEIARNVAAGRAKEPVDQAHALTKDLLGELRAVVGAMREDQPIDLAHALRTLVAGIPRPRVHLEVPETFRAPPELAHTIFRCVQEALTNAVRHADADNVFLTVEDRAGEITIVARDDGRGATSMTPGHGLTGLRERIEGMGGRVELDARPGRGVTLRALLPCPARDGGVV